MLTVLDLFSGIGGFSLGLERTGGFKTVAFCEIDPFCRRVLAKHWPEVPQFHDIRQLSAGDVGAVDVVCGGFPCQPFSVAGERRGAEDDRHLWPEMSRVIAELRPAWVIGENVAGFIPMALDGVLSDLEGQGYACRAFVVPACAVDAPHRRDRVWIVGHACRAASQRHPRGVFGAQAAVSRQGELDGNLPVRLADAGARRGGGVVADANRVAPLRPSVARHERHSWEPEPRVDRVVDGLPGRLDRVAALGNAVVPQVVEQIGRAILAAEAEREAA